MTAKEVGEALLVAAVCIHLPFLIPVAVIWWVMR